MTASGCRQLTVEYLSAPIGVGTRRPRFSWLADHDQRDFELVVEGPDGHIAWSGGRVESAETSLIEYAGEPLRSNTAYAWRVRSWSAAADRDRVGRLVVRDGAARCGGLDRRLGRAAAGTGGDRTLDSLRLDPRRTGRGCAG